MKSWLEESGQAQILTSLLISTAMLTGTLFALERGNQIRMDTLQGNRGLEMKSALDGAIQHAAMIFKRDSACDPQILDMKLGLLNNGSFDGSLLPSRSNLKNNGKSGTRIMRVKTEKRSFLVSFGPVRRIAWQTSGVGSGVPTLDPTVDPTTGDYQSGTSQDALIEVSTTDGKMRVVERAVLINNCSYPCAYTDVGATNCSVAQNPAVSYHIIDSPDVFPNAGTTAAPYETQTWYGGSRCGDGRHFGDLRGADLTPSEPDGKVGVDDLHTLRDYLRDGTTPFASESVIIGNGSSLYGCGDLNLDWQVNEVDLGILEKALRGYLLWVPATADLRER